MRQEKQIGNFSDGIFLELIEIIIGKSHFPKALDDLQLLFLGIILIDQMGKLVIIRSFLNLLFAEVDQLVGFIFAQLELILNDPYRFGLLFVFDLVIRLNRLY